MLVIAQRVLQTDIIVLLQQRRAESTIWVRFTNLKSVPRVEIRKPKWPKVLLSKV
jgi:hypothetical protein